MTATVPTAAELARLTRAASAAPGAPYLADFGMDTISLAGALPAKLHAIRTAGFTQVMLSARDLAGHPEGWQVAARHVRESGLRVTGFQVLRDFEGLGGHLHDYKVEIARSMLEMAHAVGARLLLVCSTTSAHASADLELQARDLRKLAMMAVPLGIRVAYEGLSWGRHVSDCLAAWQRVELADCPNLGLGIDSYHSFATGTPVEAIEQIDASRIFLVQLSDFMWQEIGTVAERIETARHFRVFPGEGVHSDALARLVRALDRAGYSGDYSYEVFNDDYQQMPMETVCARAMQASVWLATSVLRRAAPLPFGPAWRSR